jgi:glutamate N-acetyltransferase / amino-acid N-acetyltransferase
MTAVKGFRFSGVSAGIKKKVGALDLGLIVADEPVPVAAVFTRNLVRAQPVHVSEARILRHKKAQVCLVNSGNANACTGPAGLEAALNTTAAVGQALGISAEYVLPSSTGVIGQVLPEGKVIAALPALVSGLSEEAATFAEAIMTTDRFAKIETATIQGNTPRGTTAHVLAIGKGAGMFHPDLALAGELPQPDGRGYETGGDLSGLHATMLVYILTDAKASADVLAAALDRAVDRTLSAASVDGDTSTNDSVYLMASGKSGVEVGVDQLADALGEACGRLARSMVRDGEGAEHLVDITVRGLESDAEARDIARVVATSPLVKTAMAGKDANWGRLLAAAGRAGVPFDPDRASVFIGGHCILDSGRPGNAEVDAAATQVMRGPEYAIELVLGAGPGEFTYLTCDLGHAYVDVNAGYRS